MFKIITHEIVTLSIMIFFLAPITVQVSSKFYKKFILNEIRVEDENGELLELNKIKSDFDDIFKEVELKTLKTWNYMFKQVWFNLNHKLLNEGSWFKKFICFLYILPCSSFFNTTPKNGNVRVILLFITSLITKILGEGDIMLAFSIYLIILGLTFNILINIYYKNPAFRNKFDTYLCINRTDFYVLFGNTKKTGVQTAKKVIFMGSAVAFGHTIDYD